MLGLMCIIIVVLVILGYYIINYVIICNIIEDKRIKKKILLDGHDVGWYEITTEMMNLLLLCDCADGSWHENFLLDALFTNTNDNKHHNNEHQIFLIPKLSKISKQNTKNNAPCLLQYIC